MKMQCWFTEDVGFQEGAVEVPAYNNLDSPSFEYFYDNIHPSRGRIFDLLKIPERFDVAQRFNYLKILCTFEDKEEKTYYGWVDHVEMVSDGENPIVEVNWHVDLWRTWLKDAKFGYGMVTNRKDVGDRPEQVFNYIYKKKTIDEKSVYGSVKTIRVQTTHLEEWTTAEVFWLIVCYVKESGDSEETSVVHSVFPLLIDSTTHQPIYVLGRNYYNQDGTSTTNPMPTNHSYSDGTFLSTLGISPASVTGCWISPFCPYVLDYFSYSNSLSSGNGLHYHFSTTRYSLTTIAIPYFTETTQNVADVVQGSAEDIATSETVRYAINSSLNDAVQEMPFGQKFHSVYYRMEISPTSCALLFNFSGKWVDSRTRGLFFRMELPTYPLASNSWSDYVISGQKDAIREQRRISQLSALGSGVLGTSSGAMQAYGMASLNPKTAGIATAFGALGAGAGLVQSVGNYAIQGWANDRLNQVSDTLAGKQIDTLSLDSGSIEWYWQTKGLFALATITYDDYSIQQFNNQIALNGVSVSEPTADCTELCHGTGALRIENLIVTGSVPAEARAYIKQRFNDGVRLI